MRSTSPRRSRRDARARDDQCSEASQDGPHELDYIAAHATATQIGDIAETLAIKEALGDHAQGPSRRTSR